MHADIAGSLKHIKMSWRFFEHRGNKMTKDQVLKVLKYGQKKGYKLTSEFTDEEVDQVLAGESEKDPSTQKTLFIK